MEQKEFSGSFAGAREANKPGKGDDGRWRGDMIARRGGMGGVYAVRKRTFRDSRFCDLQSLFVDECQST